MQVGLGKCGPAQPALEALDQEQEDNDPGKPASDKTSLTDNDTRGTSNTDTKYYIFLNLKRLYILSKKCNISQFFSNRNDVNQLELMCNFVADALESWLRACKPVDPRLNE